MLFYWPACCEFEAMSSLIMDHQSSSLFLLVIFILVHIWSSLKSKAWQLLAPARVCVALYSSFVRVVWYTYMGTVLVHRLWMNVLKSSEIRYWSRCLPTGSSHDLINWSPLAYLEKVMVAWWQWTSSPESSKTWSDSPFQAWLQLGVRRDTAPY